MQPAEDRFWKYVQKGAADECWLWRGAASKAGYGRFRLGRKQDGMVGPHVFSYRLRHGEFSPDLVVCHRCDNPRCVNPDHLFLGTHKDNTKDAMCKGRMRMLFRPGPDPRRSGGRADA
jgi:hypothetical protein